MNADLARTLFEDGDLAVMFTTDTTKEVVAIPVQQAEIKQRVARVTDATGTTREFRQKYGGLRYGSRTRQTHLVRFSEHNSDWEALLKKEEEAREEKQQREQDAAEERLWRPFRDIRYLQRADARRLVRPAMKWWPKRSENPLMLGVAKQLADAYSVMNRCAVVMRDDRTCRLPIADVAEDHDQALYECRWLASMMIAMFEEEDPKAEFTEHMTWLYQDAAGVGGHDQVEARRARQLVASLRRAFNIPEHGTIAYQPKFYGEDS